MKFRLIYASSFRYISDRYPTEASDGSLSIETSLVLVLINICFHRSKLSFIQGSATGRATRPEIFDPSFFEPEKNVIKHNLYPGPKPGFSKSPPGNRPGRTSVFSFIIYFKKSEWFAESIKNQKWCFHKNYLQKLPLE